jgi:hypothetical protein
MDDAENMGTGKMRGDAEFRLQCAVIQLLRLAPMPGVFFCAIPNGEYRSKRTAGRLKAAGVVAGAPDLLVIVGGNAYGLEIKSEKGRQSPEQKAVEKAWNAAGGSYAIAYGIDEATDLLTSWRAIRPISARPSILRRAA